MFKHIRRWREDRRIKKMGFTSAQWEQAVADWPAMQRYQGSERQTLQDLSFRLLAQKRFVSGSGFAFTDTMCLKIAAMACVPILHLGLDWYRHFQTIVIYEGTFVPNRPYQSSDGVVHSGGLALSGEAWYRGPVILSWQAISNIGSNADAIDANNVVIHELAHKLDMLRDGANGAPPMHPDMSSGEWHDIFTAAWDRLQSDLHHLKALPINDYGLTSPAEFFAVCSETFFETPKELKQKLPEVYRLLCQFYRQRPYV